MPLPIPNLDDRSFEQLVTEGRSLIPRYSRGWTNHNPSDPGITLLELFAYLTETGLFQLNQVPRTSVDNFLKLLGACRAEQEALDATIARAVGGLSAPERAVTAADFEALARKAALDVGEPLGRTGFAVEAPSTALVLIIPDQPDQPAPTPSPELTARVFHELRRRCLLATRLSVRGPEYVPIAVEAVVVRRRGSGLTPREVEQALRDFLHPIRGGVDGAGWPFGRPVYRSELFQRLEVLPAVDHVEEIALSRPGGPKPTEHGIDLQPLALVFAAGVRVTVKDEDFA